METQDRLSFTRSSWLWHWPSPDVAASACTTFSSKRRAGGAKVTETYSWQLATRAGKREAMISLLSSGAEAAEALQTSFRSPKCESQSSPRLGLRRAEVFDTLACFVVFERASCCARIRRALQLAAGHATETRIKLQQNQPWGCSPRQEKSYCQRGLSAQISGPSSLSQKLHTPLRTGHSWKFCEDSWQSSNLLFAGV